MLFEKNVPPSCFAFFKKLQNDEKREKIVNILAAVAPDNKNEFLKSITSVSVTRGFNFFISEKVNLV